MEPPGPQLEAPERAGICPPGPEAAEEDRVRATWVGPGVLRGGEDTSRKNMMPW